jgi:hypothetical protein
MFAAPRSRLFAIDSGTNTTSSWLRPAAPAPFGESTAMIVAGTLPIRIVSPTAGLASKRALATSEPTMATFAPKSRSAESNNRPSAADHSRAFK